jgi:hypothetical protein
MRHAAFLLGAVFLFAVSSGAQGNPANSLLFASPDPEPAFAGSSLDAPVVTLASSVPPAINAASTPSVLGSAWSSEPAAQRPSVYGVFQNYDWQAYLGYSFFRFYALPHHSENINGINLGIVYYPAPRIGADGELLATFGSYFNQSSRFVDYLGGPRFRWSAPRGLEVWVHGLAGFSKFLPQTDFGGQSAFAYEVGGGVDVGTHRRLGYRAQVDMVSTHFFHTYQYSPKFSLGVVVKF